MNINTACNAFCKSRLRNDFEHLFYVLRLVVMRMIWMNNKFQFFDNLSIRIIQKSPKHYTKMTM